MTENTNRTGAADMQAERDRLEAATAARLERDPFAAITEPEPGPPSHLTPGCTCDHKPGDPCNASCPVHQGAGLTIAGQAPAEADPAYPDMMTPEDRAHAASCDSCRWLSNGTVTLCADAPGAPGRIRQTGPEAPAPAPAPAPAAVDLFKADWPYPVISAADFAALYSTAAEIIKARGYYEHEAQGYADEPGLSITGALKAAALEHAQAADPQDRPGQHYRTAQDLTEELETRLSAVLYVLGQLHSRTGISDLSDLVTGWTLGHFHLGPHPSAAHALALLEQAAAIYRGLADQAAPVTEAPAPASM
jgi:hypothetical protein